MELIQRTHIHKQIRLVLVVKVVLAVVALALLQNPIQLVLD